MRKRTKYWVYGLFCLVVIMLAVVPQIRASRQQAQPTSRHAAASQPVHRSTSTAQPAGQHMRISINWRKPSETVPYPDLSKVKDLWVKVDLKGNRTYLYDGQKVIYTMHARVAINHQSVVSRGQREQQIDHVAAGHTLAGRNWSALSRQSYIVAPAASDQNQVKGIWLKSSFDFPNTIQLSRPDAQWLQTLPKGTKIVIR